jgi:hypothetical protein
LEEQNHSSSESRPIPQRNRVILVPDTAYEMV